VDENTAFARLANLLHHLTGKDTRRQAAEHAMQYLASPVIVAQQGYGTGGLLLADRELRTTPAHLTIVGHKDDAAALALFRTALRGAPPSSRIEWLDVREGPLPHNDVPFPKMPQAAAFLCAGGACSMPMGAPEKLAEQLAKLTR
jgi:uncharacterized protein YyaL (SSP411 family)